MMLRLILPIALIIVVVAAAGYFIFFYNKPSPATLATTTAADNSILVSSPRPLPLYPSTTPLPDSATDNEKLLDNKITTLQQTVNTLSTQVNALSQQASAGDSASPSPAPSSQLKTPVYITLGSNGLANDQGYTPVAGFAVSLNSNDFPGASGVILEATFSRVQPGGTANLQLLNQTTNQAIPASTISTTNTSYTLISSSPFQLASGINTYALTVQSSDNTNIQIATARLKISF